MGKRVVSLFLACCLLVSLAGVGMVTVSAAQLDGRNLSVSVDGREAVVVKAFQSSYDNNLLLSLRDLAAVLSGTEKGFSIAIEPDEESGTRLVIRKGQEYTPVGGEGEPTTQLDVGDCIYASTSYNKLYLDDQEMRLPTYLHFSTEEGPAEIYVRMADLGMYFDLNLVYTGQDTLTLDTTAAYHYDLEKQQAEGYFQDLHGVVLGDANTGCVLYAYNGDVSTQIASTTKLMTYLLVKEAIDAGNLTEESIYTVSEDVYRLANSEDGIYRKKGKYGTLALGAQVTVGDLLRAMLIVSANEAATALAEMVSGSEEAFTQLMNQRAQELGLASAVFYNPHGLPDYTKSPTASKRQNEMSAEDMFRLTQYLLNNHREHLTTITRMTKTDLPSFGQTPEGKVAYAKTTNALLYNFPDCLGLKTGTTNRSGANLVSALPVTDGTGDTHDLVVVLFGGEDDIERCEKTAWLFRYARQYYAQTAFPQEQVVEETTAVTVAPTTEATQPATMATEPTVVQAPEASPEQPGKVLLMMGISFLTGAVVMLVVVILIRKTGRRNDDNPKFGR